VQGKWKLRRTCISKIMSWGRKEKRVNSFNAHKSSTTQLPTHEWWRKVRSKWKFWLSNLCENKFSLSIRDVYWSSTALIP
jgi:hypothetical protein